MSHRVPAEMLRNRLLARLRPAEFEQLAPHLELVPLAMNQPIYQVGGVIDYAFLPTHGVISAVLTMEDGTAIEVATIGNEGMTGLPMLIEPETSPSRLFVQVAGAAARIKADVLRRELEHAGPLRKMLELYQSAFMSQLLQTLACNGLHPILQRCCRWLLITHDRMLDDILPLSHELLAMMLGVRRPSVTVVLQRLKALGYVDYGRGRIEVLNREGLEATACECYRSVRQQYERLLGPDSIQKWHAKESDPGISHRGHSG
jgi:CRP-like cAMP-binding protein